MSSKPVAFRPTKDQAEYLSQFKRPSEVLRLALDQYIKNQKDRRDD